jgi:hypothetical protein
MLYTIGALNIWKGTRLGGQREKKNQNYPNYRYSGPAFECDLCDFISTHLYAFLTSNSCILTGCIPEKHVSLRLMPN